ncbi:PTEN-induced putative kinase 1 [Carabus blaptoides fortunei]
MSLRAFGGRLFKHGTAIVRALYKREYNTSTIAEKARPLKEIGVAPPQITARHFGLRNVGLQVGLHARRLFVDSVLNRVTNTLAAELRRKAARRMLFGDSGPFFALVGVSLASGTGILTKDDELEGICLEIRDAVSKIKWNSTGLDVDQSRFENEPVTLRDLELGQPIAKGCSAVVYAARLVEPSDRESDEHQDTVRASVETGEHETVISAEIRDASTRYPLAVKMMFNYDVQSSAMAILRAMYRETVPARKYYSPIGISQWERNMAARTVHLSQHPNIVAMYSVFTDHVPHLPGAMRMYPAALPARLNPDGAGRNMSLFMLMKRYDSSLQQYLSTSTPSVRTSILLLAQLLEAVVHMNMHGIAHRDLKSDNILLDTETEADCAPILVVTDFGCCLADRANGLHLPYNTMEVDKGGNTALMAPEVITQMPGTFTVINYSKSDLWAAGCIAYEIFGEMNPFYDTKVRRVLRNVDYTEDQLPALPEDVPAIIKSLVGNMLSRSPRKRLDPEVAANVCQLFLWAPGTWLKPDAKVPSGAEILQWLLCLTTKVLCEGRLCFAQTISPSSEASTPDQQQSDERRVHPAVRYTRGRRTYPEYLLISSFLSRAKLTYIKAALVWIHNPV